MGVVPTKAADAAVPSKTPLRIKLCGRCREPSEADQDGPPPVGVTFWLCPPCHDKLLGGTGRGRRS